MRVSLATRNLAPSKRIGLTFVPRTSRFAQSISGPLRHHLLSASTRVTIQEDFIHRNGLIVEIHQIGHLVSDSMNQIGNATIRSLRICDRGR